MALGRNVRIARLEGPRTASPPVEIVSLVIDPIFQIRCVMVTVCAFLAYFDGLKSCCSASSSQSLHKSPQYSLRFLILFSLFTLTIVDLDLDLVWRHAKSSFSCVVDAI